MQFLGRKKGCTKVEDQYFGKRKPSATLKRIHQKIKILESQNQHPQLNHVWFSTAAPSTLNVENRAPSSAGREVETERQESCSKRFFKNTIQPRPDIFFTSTGELRESILKDKWPTKEEFYRLLFSLI